MDSDRRDLELIINNQQVLDELIPNMRDSKCDCQDKLPVRSILSPFTTKKLKINSKLNPRLKKRAL